MSNYHKHSNILSIIYMKEGYNYIKELKSTNTNPISLCITE